MFRLTYLLTLGLYGAWYDETTVVSGVDNCRKVSGARCRHFPWKSVAGSDLQGSAEKSQKVTRGSHRNDVSPLTQGLRYRAPC